jgi:hypothetical protein
MTTPISHKLAALGIALSLNSTFIGVIAILLTGHFHQVTSSALARLDLTAAGVKRV